MSNETFSDLQVEICEYWIRERVRESFCYYDGEAIRKALFKTFQVRKYHELPLSRYHEILRFIENYPGKRTLRVRIETFLNKIGIR